MFRWCAYCQHLMGEAEPLSSYQMTHGCCESCMANVLTYKITPGILQAKSLINSLMQAGRSANEKKLDAFIQEAARAGLRNSDILVGVVQPALYEIGRLWESGEVTVGDEHRFTAFCQKVYARMPMSPVASGAPSILLALMPGNRHDLGVHIMAQLAAERGVRCRVLPVATSAPAIVRAAAQEKPSFLGLSMAMSSSLAAVAELGGLCAKAVPGLRVLLGGWGVRGIPSGSFPGIVPIRRIDDFLAELAALASVA